MHTLFILYCSRSLIKMPRGLQSNVSLAHRLVHHYHFYQLNQRETSHSIFHELMRIGINYIFLSLIAHGLPQTRTNRYHPAHHWQHPSDSSLATECVYFENSDPVKPKAGAGHELRWQNMWPGKQSRSCWALPLPKGWKGRWAAPVSDTKARMWKLALGDRRIGHHQYPRQRWDPHWNHLPKRKLRHGQESLFHGRTSDTKCL